MENPPKGVIIKQIAPANILKSGVFAISSNQLTEDYRHGLQCGLDHVFLKIEAIKNTGFFSIFDGFAY